MATPEWTFQRAAFNYLRTVLPLGSEVQSNDAAGGTMKQRQLNYARGVRQGWPDITCAVEGQPEIYIECKAKGGSLTEEQLRRGENLRRSGRLWFLAQTLEQIEVELLTLGIPLRDHTMTAAQRDAKIAAKAEKPRTAPRAAKPRGNKRQVARVNTLMLALARGPQE